MRAPHKKIPYIIGTLLCLLGLQYGSVYAQLIPFGMLNKPAASSTGPTPNPMTFAVVPAGASTSSITMTATTATDADGVQYYFDVTSTSPGASDSGWRSATAWTATGLWVNTSYTFAVKARDALPSPTETTASGTATAYTLAAVPPAPMATSPTATTVTLKVQPGSNPTTTGAWTGAQNTEFAVLCVTPCGNKYVNPAAPTTPGTWAVSETWATYGTFGGASGLALSGFSGATLYEFQVKARNASSTATALSPIGKGDVPSSGTWTLEKGNLLTGIYYSNAIVTSATTPATIRGGTNLTADAGFAGSAADSTFRSDTLASRNDNYAHMAEFNTASFTSITAATGRIVGYQSVAGSYCPEIYRYATTVGWVAGTCRTTTSAGTITVAVSSSLSDYVSSNTMAVAVFGISSGGGSYPATGSLALKTDWIEVDVTGTRDVTGPSPATSFVATASSASGGVNLSWALPSDEDFSSSSPYGTIVLLRKTGGYASSAVDATATRILGKNANGGTQNYTATSPTDTGLTNGTLYYYSLYAADKIGNWSTAAQATATPSDSAPPDVTNFAATAVGNLISLNWVNPTVSDFAYVRVLRKATNDIGAYNDGTATVVVNNLNLASQTDTPPTYGTVYYYKIFTSDGTNWSSGVTTSGIGNNDTSNLAPVLDSVTNKQFNSGTVITSFDAGNDGGDDYDGNSQKITYTCYFDTTVNGTVASTTTCSTANLANGGGFVFDGATGVISGWQPDKDAVYEVKVVGCDTLSACGSTIFTITTTVDCALATNGGTWVKIPSDTIYGTSGFCAQKYVPTNASNVPISNTTGAPWTNLSHTDSIINCASLGPNYHLITNPEWMTIAANIANKAENWSGAAVGSGTLSRGHSDNVPGSECAADANDANAYVEASCTGTNSGPFNQRRTQFLSNSAVIWGYRWKHLAVGRLPQCQ